MYRSLDKITFRALGGKTIGLIIAAICTIAAIMLTVSIVVSLFFRSFERLLVPAALLAWSEAIFTVATYFPDFVEGPNSALLNLPLFATDLCFVVIFSNSFCTFLDNFERNLSFSEPKNLDVWKFSFGDIFRVIAFIVAIVRYMGLAWTDHNFILKRIIAPIRKDKVKEFLPFDPPSEQDQIP